MQFLDEPLIGGSISEAEIMKSGNKLGLSISPFSSLQALLPSTTARINSQCNKDTLCLEIINKFLQSQPKQDLCNQFKFSIMHISVLFFFFLFFCLVNREGIH